MLILKVVNHHKNALSVPMCIQAWTNLIHCSRFFGCAIFLAHLIERAKLKCTSDRETISFWFSLLPKQDLRLPFVMHVYRKFLPVFFQFFLVLPDFSSFRQLPECYLSMSQRIFVVLQTHLAKNVQNNMLKTYTFDKK